jgi:hypothetical protein
MRVEVVGGQNRGVANDVALILQYKYTSADSFSSIPDVSLKTLPADTTATTFIEFQPPLQNSVEELRLRIVLFSGKINKGTSFVLRQVKLYAVNECGEAIYNNFKVNNEKEYYKIEVEKNGVDFNMGQNFAYDDKVRTVTSSFIKKGYNFTTRDRNHDRGRNCANSYLGGWWYSINCHNGLLTGKYPSPVEIRLPTRAPGVLIYEVVGYYSNLQSLEMMIKSDTPYSSQGEGPIKRVATCADLAAVSTDCARRCIDRPMIHGGQHPMGTFINLALSKPSYYSWYSNFFLFLNIFFIIHNIQVSGAQKN